VAVHPGDRDNRALRDREFSRFSVGVETPGFDSWARLYELGWRSRLVCEFAPPAGLEAETKARHLDC
jgi:hypothetical protein